MTPEDRYADSHTYAEGYEAYYSGLVPAMCEYGEPLRSHWVAGWRRARADDQRGVGSPAPAETPRVT